MKRSHFIITVLALALSIVMTSLYCCSPSQASPRRTNLPKDSEQLHTQFQNELYLQYTSDIVPSNDDNTISVLIADETTYTWNRTNDHQAVYTYNDLILRHVAKKLDSLKIPFTITRIDLSDSQIMAYDVSWEIKWQGQRYVPLLSEYKTHP